MAHKQKVCVQSLCCLFPIVFDPHKCFGGQSNLISLNEFDLGKVHCISKVWYTVEYTIQYGCGSKYLRDSNRHQKIKIDTGLYLALYCKNKPTLWSSKMIQFHNV